MVVLKGAGGDDPSCVNPEKVPQNGRNDLRVHSKVRSDPRYKRVTRKRTPAPKENRK